MFNIKQAVKKAIKYILIVAVPLIVTATGFGNTTILEIIGKMFPILSSITVSGVVIIFLNWLKINNGNKNN